MSTSKRSIAVFCGSASRVAPEYHEAARAVGRAIVSQGHRLVYGAGNVGLMGLVADEVLSAGGEAFGVIPQFLVDLEVVHHGLTELSIVPTMHDRKRVMAENADGFLVLPGGLGTIDEMIEVVTWRQLRLHEKPIVLVDVAGFWQPLLGLVDHLIRQGFVQEYDRGVMTPIADPEEAVRVAAAPAVELVRPELKWT